MERFQQRERNFDGRIARVLQLRPQRLIIRPDRRFIFGERQFESHVRIQMAVRKMVHDLPNGPSSGPIGRVKLLMGKARNGVAQSLRRRCNLRDRILPLSGSQRVFVLVFPNRVTQVQLAV